MPDRSTINRDLAKLIKSPLLVKNCGSEWLVDYHTFAGIQRVFEWLRTQARCSNGYKGIVRRIASHLFWDKYWSSLDAWAAWAAETIWTECCGKGDPK